MAADCGDFTENTTRLGTWIAVRRLCERTLISSAWPCPAVHVCWARQNVMPGTRPGMTVENWSEPAEIFLVHEDVAELPGIAGVDGLRKQLAAAVERRPIGIAPDDRTEIRPLQV